MFGRPGAGAADGGNGIVSIMMAKSRRRIAVVALGGGDAGGGDRGSRVDGDHRRGGAAVQVF